MALAGRGLQDLRVIVIGGSIGGLAAGVALARAGVEVQIYEKSSAEMGERGAGLVLQPDLADFMARYDLGTVDQLAVLSRSRQHLSRQGQILSSQPIPQQMTSWNQIYSRLRQAFPEERYHHNHKLTDLKQTPDGVIAQFGEVQVEADLLIGADGANSTVRQLLMPEITPQYAGYVAWRGVIPEEKLEGATADLLRERFTFFTDPQTQMLSYLIPGSQGQIGPGQRRLNWVWYWDVPESELSQIRIDGDDSLATASIPQGMIRSEWIARQAQIAAQVLPPVFQGLFKITAEPFIQPILDLGVDQMVWERVIVIGDAAFVVRPHTASGTAKAIANVSELVDCLLRSPQDIPSALMAWQPRQIQVGRYLGSMGVRYRELAAHSEAL